MMDTDFPVSCQYTSNVGCASCESTLVKERLGEWEMTPDASPDCMPL